MVQPLSSIDRLALSLASSPAEHLLLLGSGISRAANIPTGWEVTCDLIRHIMAVRGEEGEGEHPEVWFEKTFTESPNYSRVLEQAASTKSERQRLIKRYFEPSDDDAKDEKQPTSAHRAIARLVKLGLVKVIVTTNFDRLLEAALHEVQVEPVVLATPDAFAGATPIHRNRCTIIKAHGDYLNHEILNIDEELSAYPEALDALLDRLFDEHGVIVSGWSSEYDGALRAALERRTNRRYYSVWMHRGDVGSLAERLITQQGFERLQAQDADSFFGELQTKAEAAAHSMKARPESAELVANEAKRALTQPAPLIAYRDLAMREAERVRQQIEAMGLDDLQGPVNKEGATKRFDDLLDVSATLRRVLALGVFYRDQDVAEVVASIFQSFMRKAEEIEGGNSVLVELRRTVDLGIHAAVGVSSWASQSFFSFARMLALPDPSIRQEDGQVAKTRYLAKVGIDKRIVGKERRRTPVSDHVVERIGADLGDIFLDVQSMEEAFDRYEVLVAVAYVAPTEPLAEPVDEDAGRWQWTPLGRFLWKEARAQSVLWDRMAGEAQAQGTAWGPVRAGMFGGESALAASAFDAARPLFLRVARDWRF